jgi:hypothetical protein
MAFTVDIAKEGGLVEDLDYIPGTPFPAPSELITAKLLGDPVALTMEVIGRIGFYTKEGSQRWSYIAMPKFVWNNLDADTQRDVIGFGYEREGGTEMRYLFPNYGSR